MREDATMELLNRTSLIVWDEAPMQQRWVDRSLCEIRQSDRIFGEIPILLGGDFQQTLPVIPRASRAQILDKCISNSKLWQGIKKLSLTKNMRVHLRCDRPAEIKEAEQFIALLDKIGHGTVPVHANRGKDVIQINDDFATRTDSVMDFVD